ncbi:o-succinylbenzoate synthase [bacterium]|nr:o-succinylbenzoate synthase [bacterium]
MRVKYFTYCEYRIPFRTPLRTARGNLTTRRGFLVAAHGRNGEVGVGEVATLPEFGTEGYHEAHQRLDELARFFADQEIPDLYTEFPQWHGSARLDSERQPATTYGVDCALRGLQRALAQPGLPKSAAAVDMTTPFLVNSLITGESADQLVTSARQRWEVGFQTLKLKVGVLPEEEEIRALRLIRMTLPEAKIRLDANCAWPAEQAIDFCQQIESVSIEYIEDPVYSWNLEALAQFREACSIPVAIDEFFQPPTYLRRFSRWNLFDLLVLKPVRQGAIYWTDMIQQAARDNGVRVVYTTMFDTSLGLACTLNLMKELADHGIAHGLDTSRLLASDTLLHHLLPDHGKLRVLDAASLPSLVREPYRRALGLPA